MSNTLKSRISVIILITLLVSLISTMSFATTDIDEELVQEEVVEVKLNRKVFFEGNTYTLYNGKRVRKSYEEGELGCGIISMILPNKEFGIYVTGEGWISKEQIKNTDKYITLEFSKIDNALNTKLNVNGEFVAIESDNNGIITFKDGVLEGKADGTTKVNFTTKDGKQIEVLATVYEGTVELNIPEKSILANGNIDADLIDKKVNIIAEGDANATLKIEDGSIGVEAEGNSSVKAVVEDKEVLDVDVNAKGSVEASKEGISANGTASQAITLLQKLTIKLNERANANINKEEVEVGAGADASVNDKQIASGDASMKYEVGEEDPTADIKVDILENNVVNVEKQKVPLISTLKALLSKIK